MRKRLPDESFEVYKKRLKEHNRDLKRYLKGWVIWNNGTYIKNKGIV